MGEEMGRAMTPCPLSSSGRVMSARHHCTPGSPLTFLVENTHVAGVESTLVSSAPLCLGLLPHLPHCTIGTDQKEQAWHRHLVSKVSMAHLPHRPSAPPLCLL